MLINTSTHSSLWRYVCTSYCMCCMCTSEKLNCIDNFKTKQNIRTSCTCLIKHQPTVIGSENHRRQQRISYPFRTTRVWARKSTQRKQQALSAMFVSCWDGLLHRGGQEDLVASEAALVRERTRAPQEYLLPGHRQAAPGFLQAMIQLCIFVHH